MKPNRLIAPFHDGRHIFYLDLADKFVDANGTIRPDLMADSPPLHPNAKGYAIWAAALKEPLARLMK